MPAERNSLWSRLPPIEEPTPEQLARVRGSVDARVRRQFVRQRRLRLVPGLLVGMGILWWLLSAKLHPPGRMPSEVPPEVAVGIGPPAAALALSALQPACAPEAPPPPQSAVEPRAQIRPAPASQPAATLKPGRISESASNAFTPPVGPAQLGDDPEASLLGKALTRLRRDRDPQGALDVVASYRTRFPEGTLRAEATLVQAESLARLGRHHELVDLLKPAALSNLPRSTELRVLRAEALAHLDRCAEAILIFNEVLDPGAEEAPAVQARLRERALYGRALCRAQAGQLEAARRDLQLELVQFPAEAAKVHQTLQSLSP